MTQTSPSRRTWASAAALVAAGTLISACASAPSATLDTASSQRPSASAASSTPTPTSTPAPTPSPTPTPTPAPLPRSPLTGLPAEAPAPVLVVKLDNTQYAQPHAGLNRADLVYVEEVEYGITRLAAVFSSHIPKRIGPVRSARITDIDLLAQYDRPAFGFSGAQRKMWPVLAAAPFYDISPNKGAEGYSRDFSRRAPYNYYLDGRVGLHRAPDASNSQDMGFTFDEAVPPGGQLADTATMKWSYSAAGFTFDPATGLYSVSLNGQRARAEENDAGQNAATVVIQYVKQRPSAFFDKGGGNTPHAQTIGSGKAIVLRDGQAWHTTWDRPSAEDGTTFTLADGTPMAFKPGQLWIVLLDSTRRATVRPMTPVDASPAATKSPTASATPGAQ